MVENKDGQDSLASADVERSTTGKEASKVVKRSDSSPEVVTDEFIEARRISVAQFFDQNKSIAGFGNPMRATFTSVRELVENGLDAAEKLGVPPRIDIKIQKLLPKEIQELFDAKSAPKESKSLDILRISVKDNGVGVKGPSIPWLFGRVLTGTKYGAQQTRGTFGLGAKMCLLYAMSTVDVPVKVKSRHKDSEETHEYELFIDREKNEPIIFSHKIFHSPGEGGFDHPGTEVTITINGAWSRARSYLLEYFKQLAIITPYADFHITIPGDKLGVSEEITYLRVIDDMPPPPKTVPIHPWGCDITQLKVEISSSKETNLIDFLSKHFMGVSPQAAESFFEVLNIDPNKSPKELTSQEIRRIVHEGFQKSLEEARTVKRKRDRIFKFDDPRGDALSPLGAHRLRRGLEKELEPAFVEAITRPPRAYSGHPFVIEAAIGYGGGVNASATRMSTQDNKIVYRFANRIPLIFGAGSDVITKVVSEIKWNEYGLTKSSDPLAIAVSLVSTKIPFPETSKEYIDHVDEIAEEVRLALMQLGRKLRTYLRRTRSRQRERQRISRFERYAPETIVNLIEILKREGKWAEHLEGERARIISALASGEPRIARLPVPPGRPLGSADVWFSSKDAEKLREVGITSIEQFLATPNKDLAKILGKSQVRIDRIKRKTIYELDLNGRAPELPKDLLLSDEIDRRFMGMEKHSDMPYISFSESLTRRWIKTGYDYLVSPEDQLARIIHYPAKLFEQKKDELRLYANKILEVGEPDENIVAELEAALESAEGLSGQLPEESVVETSAILKPNEIDLSLISPSFNELLAMKPKAFNKRGITSHFDLLYETTKPGKPFHYEEIAFELITHLRSYFEQRASLSSDFLNQPITKLSPDWTDGYTKTAFKRRKIVTVKDFLDTELDILLDIGELKRVLFNRFIVKVREDFKTPLNRLPNELGDPEEEQNAIEVLHKTGIKTVEDFLYYDSLKILRDRKLERFKLYLLTETKTKLLRYYQENNILQPIKALKDLPKEYERFLLANGVQKSFDFLLAPLDSLIFKDFTKSRVLEIKERLGHTLRYWLPDHFETLRKHGIVSLEQLVYGMESLVLSEFSQPVQKLIKNLIDGLSLPPTFLADELVTSSDVLYDAGITTIGRFITWDKKDILRLTKLSDQRYEEIINSASYEWLSELISTSKQLTNPLKSLGFEDLALLLKKSSIRSLEEIFFLDLLSPRKAITKKQEFLSEISTVLVLPIREFLEKVLGPQTRGIKTLSEKLNRANVRFAYEFFLMPDHLVASFETGKKKQNMVKDVLERLLSPLNDEPEFVHVVARVFALHKLLHEPISQITSLTPETIRKLKDHGIRRIGQLFIADVEMISSKTGISPTSLKKILKESAFGRDSVPLYIESKKDLQPTIRFKFEDEEHFTKKELQAFKERGYYTIDQLYFKTHPYTFDAVGVAWTAVKRFLKLLESPIVLLSWEKKGTARIAKPELELVLENRPKELPELGKEIEYEEQEIVFYETLPARQMDKLAKKGIVNVIDFLLTPNDELASLLDWTPEEAFLRKTSIVLEESGLELEELDLLRPSQLKALEAQGITTLEDLYFSTNEETWNEPLFPWESVMVMKKLLRLPLKYVKQDIDEEVLNALEKIEIPSILSFILTPNEVLEQKTGMPAERFENTKAGINFSDLQDTFDKPVYLAPNLSYHDTQFLYENGYERIVDIILEKPEKLAKLLKKPVAQIRKIVDSIDRDAILRTEEERGIAIREIGIFSLQEEKIISHSSVFENNKIDTLQELYYQIHEGTYYGPRDLLEKIKSVKKALEIPVSFLIRSHEILELLRERRISLLRDLLFYYLTEDDVYDTAKESLVNTLYRQFVDLSRVVALSKLPFRSLIPVEKLENHKSTLLDIPILEYLSVASQPIPLDNIELPGGVTLLDLVRFLDSPIRITPLAQHVQPGEEALLDVRVADIVLEKWDDSESTFLITEYLRISGGLLSVLKRLRLPLNVLEIELKPLLKLVARGISTVQEFVSTDIRQLAQYSGLSQKQIREIISHFTYDKGLQRLRTTGVPIEYSMALDEDLQLKLKRHGIEFFDQIVSFGQIELAELPVELQEQVRMIKESLLGSIQFNAKLSPIQRHELRREGITTPYGLLIHYQRNGYPAKVIAEQVDLSEIRSQRESLGISLARIGVEDQEIILQLSQDNIFFVQDLYDHYIASGVPFESIPMKIRAIVKRTKALQTPIGLLDVPVREKIELYSNKQFILLDAIENKTVRELIEHGDVKDILDSFENESIELTILEGLSKRIKQRVERTDLSNFQQLLVATFIPSLFSWTTEALTNELQSLFLSPLTRIVGIPGDVIKKLFVANITQIGHLSLLTRSQAKSMLGAKLFDKIEKGQFKLASQRALKEEIATTLGISSIHELVSEYQAVRYAGKHGEILSSPIVLNSKIPKHHRWLLWTNDIKTTGALIGEDLRILASRIGVARSTLETYQESSLLPSIDTDLLERIPLSSREEKLDIFHKAATQDFVVERSVTNPESEPFFVPITLLPIPLNHWDDLETLLSQKILTLFDGILAEQLLEGFNATVSFFQVARKITNEGSSILAPIAEPEIFKSLITYLSDGNSDLPEYLRLPTWVLPLTAEQIEHLGSMGIYSVWQMIVFPRVSLEQLDIYLKLKDLETYSKRYKVLPLPIDHSELKKKTITVLERHGYSSIFGLPDSMISEFTPSDYAKLLQMKGNVKASTLLLAESSPSAREHLMNLWDLGVKNLEEIAREFVLNGDDFIASIISQFQRIDDVNHLRKHGLPLSAIPNLKAQDKRFLEKRGVYTLEDFISNKGSIQISEEIAQKANKFFNTTVSSIPALAKILSSENLDISMENLIIKCWFEFPASERKKIFKILASSPAIEKDYRLEEIIPDLPVKDAEMLGLETLNQLLHAAPKVYSEMTLPLKKAVVSYLITNPLRMSGIDPKQAQKLLKHGLTSRAHVLYLSSQELGEMMGISSAKAEALKNQIIVAKDQKGLFPIETVSFLSALSKNAFEIGINYLDDVILLSHDTPEIFARLDALDLLTKINDALNIPSWKFVQFTDNNIEAFEESIKSLRPLLSENIYVALLEGENVSEIKNLLGREPVFLEGLDRETQDIMDALINDYFFEYEDKPLTEIVGTIPLTFVIESVSDLISLYTAGISRSIHLLFPQIIMANKKNDALKNFDLGAYVDKLFAIDIKEQFQSNGYPIELLSIIPKPQIESLRESGCLTIQQFLALSPVHLPKIKGVTEKNYYSTKETLQRPIFDFITLAEIKPTVLSRLAKNNVRQIDQFLFMPKSWILTETKLEDRLVQEAISNLGSRELRAAAKIKIPQLKNFPEIRAQDQETLKEFGITDVRQLMSLNSHQQKALPSELSQKIAKAIRRLQIPLELINEELATAMKKSFGVKTWGELLFVPDKRIHEETGLSYATIRKMKFTLPSLSLATKTERSSKASKPKSTAKSMKTKEEHKKQKGKKTTTKPEKPKRQSSSKSESKSKSSEGLPRSKETVPKKASKKAPSAKKAKSTASKSTQQKSPVSSSRKKKKSSKPKSPGSSASKKSRKR